MNIGQRFTLAWKHPHRIEATIAAFEQDYVLCDVDHRCGFSCYLHGVSGGVEPQMRYRYDDFAKLFVPLAVDAIALAGA